MMYVSGRNNSLIALDATTGKEIWIHEGIHGISGPRHQLLGERGRQGPPADFLDRALPAGDRRRAPASPSPPSAQDGIVDLRTGPAARRARLPHSRIPARSSRTCHPRVGHRRRLHVAARRHPRLRRRHRQAGVAVPHRAAAGRVRLRDLAEGRLQVRRRREHLGRDVDRRRARHRLLADRLRHLRLLRRRPHRRRTCLPTACSRSTRAPASGSGISRPSITISGTTTTSRRRSWSRSRTTAEHVDVVAHGRARPASSTCSIA